MKFIEKERSNSLESGDFILFFNGDVGVVADIHGDCGVVRLEDGLVSSGLEFSDLESLEDYIKSELPSARIIKSKNIVITEV